MPNKFIVVGRLTKDPEVKMNIKGVADVTFFVADNSYNPQTQENTPHYFMLRAYDKIAQKIETYHKGDLLYIDATAKTYSKVNQYGDKTTNTVYVVYRIQRLASKQPTATTVQEETFEILDIPFDVDYEMGF